MDLFPLTKTDLKAIKDNNAVYLNRKGAEYYTNENYSQAVRYYQLAAAMGDSNAILNLGYCYLYGRSLKSDLSMALAYFELARQLGNPDAAYKLGAIHEKDSWGIQDKELSLYYYGEAVKLVTGKDVLEINNPDLYVELEEFPSLCFAILRATLPTGGLSTISHLAHQYYALAERGYKEKIANGQRFYQKSLEDLENYFIAKDVIKTLDDFEKLENQEDYSIFSVEVDDKNPIPLVEVSFDDFGRNYSYCCYDNSFEKGQFIAVPVGKSNTKKVATVVRCYEAYPEDLPFPLHKLKRVIGPVSIFNKERAERIVDNLISSGKLLDLTEKEVAIDETLAYDLLKTPLGHFWLEKENEPIPMAVSFIQRGNLAYLVDYALRIKPEDLENEEMLPLQLCADFDIDACRFVDNISDERVWGYSWEVNGIQFGLTATESEFEDEVTTFDYSRVPYYEFWDSDHATEYGFNLAWKPYDSDYDSSIFFYTT